MSPPKILNQSYPKKYQHEFCDYGATSPIRIDQHKKLVHGDKKLFACSFPGCQFRTKYPNNLEDHEPRHDPVLSTRYKCPMCQRGFPSSYEMERHVRTHVKEKLNKCSECNFKCITKSGLRSHVERRHGTENKGITKTVALETDEPENIVIPHEVGKDEDGTTVHKCLFPGCSYKTKFGNMAKHKTRHKPRNAKTLLKCTAVGCFYETKWICYYRTHVKRHDPNRQRNSVCPLCPKRFWDAVGLKRHARTHTGEKVYKCQYCDYASAESSNLYRHRRKYHSELMKETTENNNSDVVTTEQTGCLKFKENPTRKLHVINTPIVILKRIVICK